MKINNTLIHFSGKTEPFCQPGKTFKNDCNNCKCSDDGLSAVCTLKVCEKHQIQKRGEEFLANA